MTVKELNKKMENARKDFYAAIAAGNDELADKAEAEMKSINIQIGRLAAIKKGITII